MMHPLRFSALVTRFSASFVLLALAGLPACSTAPAGDPAGSQAGNAPPASAPAAMGAAMFTGTVVETMNSGGYTYMRLQSGDKDVWVAATEMPVKEGDSLTVSLDMPMENFHSTTLDRDFPMVYFVSGASRAGDVRSGPAGAAGSPAPMGSHASGGGAAQAGPAAVQPTAPPAGGLSIADVWTKRESLSGKEVTVRGTVVKVNNAIMGRNWFHLQDGSGSASDGTNDLTVTTDAVVKVGDVVTVTGTLGTQKDFGAGYAYEAILENGSVK
jgi:hypothetical protein